MPHLHLLDVNMSVFDAARAHAGFIDTSLWQLAGGTQPSALVAAPARQAGPSDGWVREVARAQ